MAGHSPTVLELTPTDRRTSIPALLDFLRREYGAEPRQSPPGARWTRAGGAISLGAEHVVFSIELADDPADPALVRIAVELDEQAYEAAFDIYHLQVREPGKQELIDFCVKLALATQAEGFRLCFAKEPRLSPTLDELVEGLTVADEPCLVAGIRSSSRAAAQVKQYWPNIDERDEYLIVDFLE